MTKQNTGKGLAAHAMLQRMSAQRTFVPSPLRQQAGREGPRKPSPWNAQELHTAKGSFYPVRHEDLHAPGPRMKINQPKCMCRASQGKGGMRGTCADAKISLGDAFLYGAIALIG